jgi:two-component system LytT family sensor kinase
MRGAHPIDSMQDTIRKKELAALKPGAMSCAPEPLAKFVVRVPDSSDEAPECGGLPFAMAMRRLPLAFAPARPTARPSWRMVVDWAILPVKRTKSATKRIRDPVEMRDAWGALHSFLSDIADLRPCRPRADGTYISTDNRISLASGRTLSKATLFWVLHLGGWIAFGTFVWALNIADIGPFPSALEQLLWVGCGFAFTLGFRVVFRGACSAGWSYTSLIMLAATLSVLTSPIWYVVFMGLLRASIAGPVQALGLSAMWAHEASEVAALPRWWPPIGYWMYFTSLLSTWCSLYFGIKAMLDLEAERARSVRALKLADSARLRALQSQLNPHFLFNALNGIATLIREGERTRAADTVDTLSDFLRLTLQKLDSPEIPVREELAFVEQYLRIQRLRFGSTFRASVDADPETHDALVPTLILQPLVENAVRHGVLARAQGGALSVSIRRRDEVLVITVEDDGPGLGDESAHPYGVGFKNSAERLAALYGDDAHMSVGARPHGRGFVVVVFLPFRKASGTTPANPARVTVPV